MQKASAASTLATILLGLLFNAGCEPDPALLNEIAKVSNPIASATPVSVKTKSKQLPARAQETVLVASFNIQVFGESKMNDRWVMEHLAEVIRQFDVVAIQEVRAKDQSILQTLVNFVNANGGRYDYLIGPRLGRSVSKEQYAYVYDSSRIITSNEYTYTLNDDIDALHREPLIARFVVRTSLTANPWTFSLVNLHTDPDEAVQEVDAMGGILREIRNFEFMSGREDDVILLGDLNAGPEKMSKLQTLAGCRPLLNEPTNVRENAVYDNIIIDPGTNLEFTGNAGVLKLRTLFNISEEDALKLSDHNPVWAEFLVEERSLNSQQQMANQPNYGPR
ncbi:MAG: endonuclease/exonuclease/phosphatase family protein [Pirellulaceae bacterium]|nr:endonuclease/exonuclease/phosphatase family protein [Pirellulaceae bacterium]